MDIDVFRGVAPFVAVAEELSFGRAAARLGVTTAAVSKAVQVLEGELGVTLLERTSRTVALTRDGALFFDKCRAAFATVSGAREEVTALRGAPHGEAVVSAPFVLAPLVMSALAPLRVRHPRLVVRLQVTDQMAKLAAERVDVAVRIGEAPDTLVQKLLLRTRWRTVASPAYLARRGTPADVEALRGHDCLVFVAPNGRVRPWAFDGKTFEPDAALITDYGPSLLDAAREGMGIAHLFDFMLADDLKRGALVEVLPEYATEGPPLRALCRPGRMSANVRSIFAELGRAFVAA
jgi:LysR family transcriptional regulator, regulator for bpeEF and oprC